MSDHARGVAEELTVADLEPLLTLRHSAAARAGDLPDSIADGAGAIPKPCARAASDRNSIASQRIVRSRRLRVDTTVVETDIHYPTDSSLLSDGVRVLTSSMQR